MCLQSAYSVGLLTHTHMATMSSKQREKKRLVFRTGAEACRGQDRVCVLQVKILSIMSRNVLSNTGHVLPQSRGPGLE